MEHRGQPAPRGAHSNPAHAGPPGHGRDALGPLARQSRQRDVGHPGARPRHRAPLGIDFATPPDAGAAAATQIWELRWPFWFGAKSRLGSFTLTATDADWTIGTGPEIAGTISAILLLLTGRTEAATPC